MRKLLLAVRRNAPSFIVFLALTPLAFLTLSGEASATNITGETVRVNYENQQSGFGLNVQNSETVVVGAGVELEPISLFGSIDFDIDITANTIIVTKPIGNVSFGGLPDWPVNSFRFFDIGGTIPDFNSFSIQSQSGVGGDGLSAADLSFTADQLDIYLGGTFWQTGSTATFVFSTVPGPGTAALFGFGLVGLVCARRGSGRWWSAERSL